MQTKWQKIAETQFRSSNEAPVRLTKLGKDRCYSGSTVNQIGLPGATNSVEFLSSFCNWRKKDQKRVSSAAATGARNGDGSRRVDGASS